MERDREDRARQEELGLEKPERVEEEDMDTSGQGDKLQDAVDRVKKAGERDKQERKSA